MRPNKPGDAASSLAYSVCFLNQLLLSLVFPLIDLIQMGKERRGAPVDRNRQTAPFIEPMECLPVKKIPQGRRWTYELKLDGYRLEAIKTSGKVSLYSRRGHDLIQRFYYIAHALQSMPEETVIDGELVARVVLPELPSWCP